MFSRTLLATLAVVSVASAQMKDLASLLSDEPLLSELNTLLKGYPDIASTLVAAKNVTVLAPFNKAIRTLSKSGALDDITEDQVAALLDYHVLPGVIMVDDVPRQSEFVETLLDNKAYENVTGGQVVQLYKPASIPIIISGLATFTTVVGLDFEYDNGVVQIVDRVLTIPPSLEEVCQAAGLTAFLGAAEAAGITDALNARFPDLTIFVPTNDAFAAIGSALGDLDENQLTDILEYHVLQGPPVAYSSELENGKVPTLLQGKDVLITVQNSGDVYVNSARVINPNNLFGAGVIHIIDSVLNPNNDTAVPEPSAVVQFSGASSAPVAALTSGLPPASTTVAELTASNPPEGVAPSASSTSGGMGGGSGGEPASSTGGATGGVFMLKGAAVVAGLLGVGALAVIL